MATVIPISFPQMWSCGCHDNMYSIWTPLKLGRVASLLAKDYGSKSFDKSNIWHLRKWTIHCKWYLLYLWFAKQL